MKEKAINLAKNELKICSFAATKQYLEDHKPLMDGGEPIIVHVAEKLEPAEYIVYFQLDSVEYLLAIPIFQNEQDLELGLAYLQAKINVFFRIGSDTLSIEKISKRLELLPTRALHKGEPIVEGHKKQRDYHIWIYEPEPGVPGDLCQKLDKLLAILEPKQAQVLELASVAATTIWIDYFGNSDYLDGFSLDAKTIQRIAALGCDIDFDMYVSSPKDPITK